MTSEHPLTASRFLAAFKKDKSHYGWPVGDDRRGISLDAMIGASIIMVAARRKSLGAILYRYTRVVESMVDMVVGIAGVTAEEKIIGARAREFNTSLLEEFDRVTKSGKAEPSLNTEFDIPPKQTAADTVVHFRKSRWGMSPEEVKKTELAELVKEEQDALFYNAKIADLEAWTVYIFSGGILVRAKYVVTERHADNQQFLTDYITLRDLLVKKYGPIPASNNFASDSNWSNDLFRNDFDQYGLAISIGHLSYFATWEIGHCVIVLSLFGDNHVVHLHVEYSSRDYGEIESEERLARHLDDL